MALLRFIPPSAGCSVDKLIRSAAVNAENGQGVVSDEPYIAKIYADDGQCLRRYRFGARLRIKLWVGRTSTIIVVLGF